MQADSPAFFAKQVKHVTTLGKGDAAGGGQNRCVIKLRHISQRDTVKLQAVGRHINRQLGAGTVIDLRNVCANYGIAQGVIKRSTDEDVSKFATTLDDVALGLLQRIQHSRQRSAHICCSDVLPVGVGSRDIADGAGAWSQANQRIDARL